MFFTSVSKLLTTTVYIFLIVYFEQLFEECICLFKHVNAIIHEAMSVKKRLSNVQEVNWPS